MRLALLSDADGAAAGPAAGGYRLLPDGTYHQDTSTQVPDALKRAGEHAMWDPLGMGCVDGGAIDDPFPGGKGDLRVEAFCIPQPCAAPVTEEQLARDVLGRLLREGEYAMYLDRRAASCFEVASLSDNMRDIFALLTARPPGMPILASTLHHAAPILSAQLGSARTPAPRRAMPTGVIGSGGVRLADGLRAAPGPGVRDTGDVRVLPATGSGPKNVAHLQGPAGSVPATSGNPPPGAGQEGPGGPLPEGPPEVTVVPLPPTFAALLVAIAALTLRVQLYRRRREPPQAVH